MIDLAELRRLAAGARREQFTAAIGPFVLLQKPPEQSPSGSELGVTKGLAQQVIAERSTLLKENLGSLHVALLPPMSPGSTLRVGRGAENDLILQDQSSSKSHAELCWSQNQCEVTDLHSLNGTSVNGRPIESSQILQEGDVVGFGGGLFVYYTSERIFDLLRREP